jgi:hypothetical protein
LEPADATARTGEPQTTDDKPGPHTAAETAAADERASVRVSLEAEEEPSRSQEGQLTREEEPLRSAVETPTGSLREALDDAVERVRLLFRWRRGE